MQGCEVGEMIPTTKESLTYWSIASLSWAKREYQLPLGGDVPGHKSIAQVYRQCGGRVKIMAQLLR